MAAGVFKVIIVNALYSSKDSILSIGTSEVFISFSVD
jgi:hypothetical protein